MPTADDILGPPRVEDILGPPPVTSAAAPTQEQLRAAPSPLPAPLRWPLGVAAGALGGALEVAAPVGATLQNALTPANARLGALYQKYTGEALPPSTAASPEALGLSGNPLLAPQSEGERTAQRLAAGAGAGAVMAPFGGAAMIPASVAGAGAGEAARRLGAPPILQEAAGVVGGLGTQIGGMLLRKGIPAIAEGLGKSTTLDQAGALLQDKAAAWRHGDPLSGEPSKMDQIIEGAKAPLDQVIPGYSLTPPDETAKRFGELIRKGDYGSDAAKFFLNRASASGGEVGAAADKLAGHMSAGNWFKGTPSFAPMTWDDARMLRTSLGTALRTQQVADRAAIKHLYGGLSSDMGNTAQTLGAGDLFQHFNAVSTAAHEFDSGPIESILSAQTPSRAAKRILDSGTGKAGSGVHLQALRAYGLDEPVNEMASASLRLDPTGKDFAKFAPEAQAQLVQDPASRLSILESLPSKTPRSELVERSIRAILPFGSIGEAVAGSVGRAIGESIGAFAPYALRGTGRMFSNPLYGVAGGLGGSVGGGVPGPQQNALAPTE